MNNANFYVSPYGNDAWSGTLPDANPMRTDGPFATIHRAQQAVRGAKPSPSRPVTVLIRAGTYSLNEPLIFTPKDSFTTWAAYPGEEPVISGGRKITGWRKGEGDLWHADIPEVASGNWYFHDLYVNGERRHRPRLPKEGFFRIEETLGDEVRNAFKYADGDIRKWENLEEVEVIVINAWCELRLRISDLDEKSRKVTFTGSNNWPFGRWEKNRYFVENVREALDTPGEWYLDRNSGVLTYYPLPGEDVNKIEVVAPLFNELVRIEGHPEDGEFVEHLHLKGVSFQYTGWSLSQESYISVQAANKISGVITAQGARNCIIEGCEITRVGKYGIEFSRGCRDNRIIGNRIHNMGAGGIKIGESRIRDPESERTSHNLVSRNHIYDGGKNYLSAVGVWIGQSGHNVVADNHIHDLFYTGISAGWTWGYGRTLAEANIIEHNHIHDIGKGLLSDMGGIYTLGTSPGSVIRNNLIHDIESYSYGGWGIYPDEGSTSFIIENNIVYSTKTGGFHQHYGKENIVRNNIFAYASVGQIQRTRAEEHISFTFENNIVYWTDGPLLHGNWSGDNFIMDRNVYWSAAGKPVDFAGLSFEDWKAKGMDVNSIIADPLFQDPERHDFRLKPDSPAFDLGFKPIVAGVRKE